MSSLLQFKATLDRPREFRVTLEAFKRIEAATGFYFFRLAKDPTCMPDDIGFVAVMLAEFARAEDPTVTADTIRPHLTLEKVISELGPAIAAACASTKFEPPGCN